MTPFFLKDYFPVSGSLEISFVTAQTQESEIQQVTRNLPNWKDILVINKFMY